MEVIITDKSRIRGHIYVITNETNGKQYVGQAASHRKNHGKYRLFGYEGRFRDHISEALCNTKKKQCWYLNNAIRRHGATAFSVRLLEECSPEQLDALEQKYIDEFHTFYPNGYNLTRGGRTLEHVLHDERTNTNAVGKRGGCDARSGITRQRIGERVSAFYEQNEAARKERALKTQSQHKQRKLDRWKNVDIDPENIEKYMTAQKNRVVVRIDGKMITFAGKRETPEQWRKRALEFLQTLATLPNCSGNP
jgi:group I intron endonuclease